MKKINWAICLLALMGSCKKEDKTPLISAQASEGKTVQLEGLVGTEAGTAAGNSVYVSFSTDKQTAVARSAWDLAFYNGSEFRVCINWTTAATAIISEKTDLSTVSAADTVGKKILLNAYEPVSSDFNLLDDVHEDINKTVIPEISSSFNKVIILSRGTGGKTPQKDLVKLKITKTSNGYKVEYAAINESSTKTVEITKNDAHHYQYFSVDNGVISVEPQKKEWDILWTLGIYETNMGTGLVPYVFSDLIATNFRSGVSVATKEYASETEATEAFEKYSSADIAKETFKTNKWAIGDSWRKTAGPGSSTPAGTYKTKFYVIKDAKGNNYKLKCISFTTEDGGTRGKPELKYVLIK